MEEVAELRTVMLGFYDALAGGDADLVDDSQDDSGSGALPCTPADAEDALDSGEIQGALVDRPELTLRPRGQ